MNCFELAEQQVKLDSLSIEREIILRAWQAQNACNLSGVVLSFARDMQSLCDIQRILYPDTGTQWKNEHIACKLYASKIAQLTGDLPLDHWVYKEV